ncbi:315_t:CDS:1, partial [Cetraspora pellucida]
KGDRRIIETKEEIARGQKRNEILTARQKALQEINQTISECNVSIEEAKIDWLDESILPN